MIVIPILQPIYFLQRHKEFYHYHNYLHLNLCIPKIIQLRKHKIIMGMELILGERCILCYFFYWSYYWSLSSEFLRVLLFKYEWIKSRAVGESQYQKVLAIERLWSTQSYPLERLVDNAPDLFPLSTSFL